MEKFSLLRIPRPEPLGKYRRSFNWRFARQDDAKTEEHLSAIWGLAHSENLDILEDYLYISRKRNSNRAALARLQSHLVGEHLATEETIKELKKQLKSILSSGTEKQNQRAQYLSRAIQENRLFANCLRVIGDGIAWRALGFDRIALRALSGSRGSQNLMDLGLAYELKEWKSHFDRDDAIPIINALTNWLTIGDVTVIERDGSVEVVEVKSGRTKSSRTVRQRQALRDVVSFLSTGSGTRDERHVEVYNLAIEAEHGLDILEKLLMEAGRSGYAMKELGSFYFVDCRDNRFEDKLPWEKLNAEREVRIKHWVGTGGLTLTQESMAYLSFTPLIAPFSIFPLAERTCLELALGIKSYTVRVNLSAIAREFERRGWKSITPEERIKRAKDDPTDPISTAEGFLILQKDGCTIGMQLNEISRMQMELLRPQVLIKAYDRLNSLLPRGNSKNLYYLEYGLRESHIWR